MDILQIIFLLVGIIIGALTGGIVAFVLLRRDTAHEQQQREEIITNYEHKIRAIVEQYDALARDDKAHEQQQREVIITNYEDKIRTLVAQQSDAIKEATKRSTDASRWVLKGKMAEQMAPLLPGFRYAPADAHFLGDPIDYIVFHGYTDMRDNGNNSDDMEVVILDIKHGTSRLTKYQTAIARAVERGNMRFEVVRVQEDGTITAHTWKSKKVSG